MKSQELVLRHWRVETSKLFRPQWFLKQTFLFNKVIYKGEATGFIFARYPGGSSSGDWPHFGQRLTHFCPTVLSPGPPNITTHNKVLKFWTQFIPNTGQFKLYGRERFSFVLKSVEFCCKTWNALFINPNLQSLKQEKLWDCDLSLILRNVSAFCIKFRESSKNCLKSSWPALWCSF